MPRHQCREVHVWRQATHRRHLLAHVLVTEGCYLLPHGRHPLPERLEHRPELRKVLLWPDVWPAGYRLNSEPCFGAFQSLQKSLQGLVRMKSTRARESLSMGLAKQYM